VGTISNVDYKRFLALLITARKDAGLTQQEIATKLKKQQSFVSKYERGERRLDVVEFLAVASAIGIEPCAFLRELSKNVTSKDAPNTHNVGVK
jgi:transcriptional regulator with XRE-family HTH domain